MADYTHGRFVWRDLLAKDLDGARRYYGELFGWTTRNFRAHPRTTFFKRAKRWSAD